MTSAAKITETERDEIYDAISEALAEIRRINEARGETVFNPSATQALRSAREILRAA